MGRRSGASGPPVDPRWGPVTDRTGPSVVSCRQPRMAQDLQGVPPDSFPKVVGWVSICRERSAGEIDRVTDHACVDEDGKLPAQIPAEHVKAAVESRLFQ